MATQLADAPADHGGEHNDNGPAAIDYVAEASKMGWRPPEDFKGDPAKHIDAETFYNRGQEMMPILQATNARLLKRLDAAERTAKQAAEFFSKAEQRAYERAVADIRKEQEEAVESGDIAAHRAAGKKLDELEKPAAAPQAAAADKGDRAEEFAGWVKANPWYANNEAIRAYADSQADKIMKTKGGILERSDLDEVAERTKAMFEDAFPDAFGAAPKRTPRNAVDGGGTAPRQRGGRTFADLPPEAQQICDKWIKQGNIKNREDYVKNYPW
jgi:hypothetical protein